MTILDLFLIALFVVLIITLGRYVLFILTFLLLMAIPVAFWAGVVYALWWLAHNHQTLMA